MTLKGLDGTLDVDTPPSAELAASSSLRLHWRRVSRRHPEIGVAVIDQARPTNGSGRGPDQEPGHETGEQQASVAGLSSREAGHAPDGLQMPQGGGGGSSTGSSSSSTPPVTGGIAGKGGAARSFGEVPKTPAVWIATFGGVGFGPWAPGTWGAAITAIAFGLYLCGMNWLAYGVLIVLVTAVGVWASTAAERDFARHDDGRIVIDEVAGQLVTLWPLVPLHDLALGHFDLSFGLSPETTFLQVPVFGLLVVTGFVAFRWFDIRKPGLVRWAERRFEAGAGVMADDVVAGVYGAVALIVPTYLVLVARGLGGGV